MANRRTLPEKWADPWFRRLQPDEKIVFLFLCDQCNWGGFYELDCEAMSFAIGLDESRISGAIQGLNRGCLVSDNWVWVKNFVRVQGNADLNPGNNAHKNIIRCIQEQVKRFENVPEFQEFFAPYKPLISPPVMSCNVMSLDSSLELTEDSLLEDSAEPKNGSIYPEDFKQFWDAYPKKEGKGGALKIWKRDKCKAILPDILKALESYKRSAQWTKEGGQFIPNPEKWLNKRQYDDEPRDTNGLPKPKSIYGDKPL